MITTEIDVVFFRIEGVRHPPDIETHIERINRNTVNPAHVPGLDYVSPLGKGIYPKER